MWDGIRDLRAVRAELNLGCALRRSECENSTLDRQDAHPPRSTHTRFTVQARSKT